MEIERVQRLAPRLNPVYVRASGQHGIFCGYDENGGRHLSNLLRLHEINDEDTLDNLEAGDKETLESFLPKGTGKLARFTLTNCTGRMYDELTGKHAEVTEVIELSPISPNVLRNEPIAA